jgi:hypothetical protein
MAKKRNETAIRFRALRGDASIKSAQWTIEQTFKLPEGSVRLVNPSGRRIRSDASVDALLKNWIS